MHRGAPCERLFICSPLRPLFSFPSAWRIAIIGPDMPVISLIITAAGSILATVLFMLFVRRLQYRLNVGRKLIGLLNQQQYDFILLDVRPAAEYAESHICGARNLPTADIRDNLPTEKMFEPIYVYARNWREARNATRLLDETGYFNATCYGAFRGWKGPKCGLDAKD